MKFTKVLVRKKIEILEKSEWFPALLTRFTIAAVFIQTGWGKLHHLEKLISYFESLGIPLPGAQAPFIAALEFFGGIGILLGFGTRLFSVLLVGTMAVAIRTAKWEEVNGLASLTDLTEYLYLALMVWLVFRGAGKISIDSWVRKKWLTKKP